MPTVVRKNDGSLCDCPGWQTGNLQQLPGARGAPRPDVEFNLTRALSRPAPRRRCFGVAYAVHVSSVGRPHEGFKRKPYRLASSPLLQERPVGFRFLRYMLGAKLVEMFVVM